MATLGHIAVGMAAGRLYTRPDDSRLRLAATMLFLSLVSLSPDLDVIAFALRIPYDAEWGHRGAAHSLGFALIVAVVASAAAAAARLPPTRTGVAVFVVMASHGLLDTLTDGGLGIALLWPLSNERFFAPVQPLPVAPIGRAFISLPGLKILAIELAAFSPLLVLTFWPRRRPR